MLWKPASLKETWGPATSSQAPCRLQYGPLWYKSQWAIACCLSKLYGSLHLNSLQVQDAGLLLLFLGVGSHIPMAGRKKEAARPMKNFELSLVDSLSMYSFRLWIRLSRCAFSLSSQSTSQCLSFNNFLSCHLWWSDRKVFCLMMQAAFPYKQSC